MNLTAEDTQNKMWLSKNKVCFVTNSIAAPSSLFITSLKTYIDYIPIQNFWLIPGLSNGEPFYGIKAFLYMLNYMLNNKHFDYVIYIDEDCFINDFSALVDEFKIFVNSGCCIGGSQDGGTMCHRNHSKIMVNTFLSFWNIKLLREKNIELPNILQYFEAHHDTSKALNEFNNILKIKNNALYNFMYKNADECLSKITKLRKKLHGNEDVPYCKIVRDDPTNSIEQHQEPYTFDDDKTSANFEPYYVIEQALVYLTDTPIYYFYTTDLYEQDNDSKYNGLTSAVYYRNPDNNYKLIAVHTWYSRAYTKWPANQEQLDHTKRINGIIKNYSRI